MDLSSHNLTCRDNRPIGVFDSGLGGLTVVPYLLHALPEERVVYFGDTARTPYGSKSVKTIQQFSREIVSFLVEQDCKAILIACNTVSSTCIDNLVEHFPDLPFIGIIEPVVEEVIERYSTEPKKLGVIGTKVTIESGVYSSLFKTDLPGVFVREKACPIFVPLIEEGLLHHEMMELAIHHYLDDFICDNELDELILGCTHYHLLEDKIQASYPDLHIINPAQAQVSACYKILKEQNLLAEPLENHTHSVRENIFYASDLSENFRSMIENISLSAQNTKIEFKNLER